MSSNSMDGVATNVVKMMAALITATEIAGRLAGTANSVCDAATAVANKSHEALMELTEEAASIAQSEVREFRDAVRLIQASGEGLRLRCLELSNTWNSFEAQINNFIKSSSKQTLSNKNDVQPCIQLLQLLLQCAAECGSGYQEFREKLNHAIDVGSELAQRCRVAAEDARSQTSNMKLVGHAAAVALSVLGFLADAAGGPALKLVGAVVAGAEAYTHGRVSKLDGLAKEFDVLREKLNNALKDLNLQGDCITGLFEVTKVMAEKMEIALNFFREHERERLEKEKERMLNVSLKQETENQRRRNEELERNILELQGEVERQKRWCEIM